MERDPCPKCGCKEVDIDGDFPAGRWWSACKECRLPCHQFQDYVTPPKGE